MPGSNPAPWLVQIIEKERKYRFQMGHTKKIFNKNHE